MADWRFEKKERRQKTRDPMQEEFFANSSIDNAIHALVREAIQNSLDARKDDTDGAVSVRFALSSEAPVAPDVIGRFVSDVAWEHFHARNNGLVALPDKGRPCRYLVYEDFGTTGLIGDIHQDQNREGTDNPFYFFMRAEGQSGKSVGRGRWGVGKFVFPHVSAIRSFLMLTVREDDGKELLAGQSILKSHQVNGVAYTPDGWFGEFDPADGFQLPCADPVIAEHLRKVFRLRRKPGETGLSVIMPYVREDLTIEGIVEKVIREYFFPILKGQLVVTVEAGDRIVLVNRHFLLDLTPDSVYVPDAHSVALIKLAKRVLEMGANQFIALGCPEQPGAPSWENRIEKARAHAIRGLIDAENGVAAMRVPLFVQVKKEKPALSHFDLFLERDDASGDGKPIFVREGIKIPESNARAVRGYRCLVVIDDKPIATMLGDAENPAHTEWEKNSSKYRDKYNWGPRTIDFMRSSLQRVVHLLSHAEEEEDRDVLADIFYIEEVEPDDDVPERRRQRVRKPIPGEEPRPRPEPPEARPKKYQLRSVDGGFVVQGPKTGLNEPHRFIVRVAYDRAKGNPWKKYSPDDFDLAKRRGDIEIEERGIEALESAENRLQFNSSNADFSLKVTGFDPNRDIIVDVTAQEIGDAAV